MNAEITGEIPHIDGGQSPDRSPASQRGAARPLGPAMLRAAVV